MRSRLLAVKLAALVSGLLTLIAARPAPAIDIELPGERTLMIHGFYETRLRTSGRNLPFGGDGVTYSQFRHVLDLETELDLLPEGAGVFDALFFFSRWVFKYECIYDRSCGFFDSADSYGDNERNPFFATRNPKKLNRMPKNLKPAKTPEVFAGGVFPLAFRPGTLIPIRTRLNPGFRYRNCFNEPGQVGNPSLLLGAFCNLEDRSILDGPIDEFPGARLNTLTRAGSFNTNFRFNLLQAARPNIGEARFRELAGLLRDDKILEPQNLGLFRALAASSARARAAGDTATADELEARAAALVDGTFDTPEITQELLE
ncbi:MAG: hypothetical protein E2O71_03365, partial [Deltaproteobacteria bacterium]